MVKKSMKKIISLLLAASMVFAMAGCGGDDVGTDEQGANVNIGDNSEEIGNTEESGSKDGNTGDGPTAMGRYVEEQIDVSEQATGATDLCVREDGKLVIVDRNVGMLVSEDQGTTWNTETPDWLADYQEHWISSMCMAPDGTVALTYYVGDSNSDDPDFRLVLILPDGTQVPVEADFPEDEMYFRQIVMGDDNRIFASSFGAVYEVFRDGNAEKILTLDINPSWMWVKGNLLFIDNEWELDEAPIIYDLDKEEYVADEALTDFVGENYKDRIYNGTDYGAMYLLPGDDGTVYITGKKGIHRHVIGGNMMEQILDGNLSLLSNPDYWIIDMLQLEDNVFLGLFTGGKLIKFTYDPNVPAVPENMITIYSLREDANIRQAVSLYQVKHPDVFVSYQIGMGSGDAVTREDAIKKLNTEIMAGEGPDLIVVDELPFDSYVDKGMLVDLTDYLAQYSSKEPLFDNVIEAMKRDGKAYAAPATIAVPYIISGADGLENITDLPGLAEVVEKLREENPGQDLMAIGGERGLMKRFAATSEPGWITTEGTIDREILGEYLEQCKRIFEAQMEGLGEEVREQYEHRMERISEFNGVDAEETEWSINLEMMSYIGKETKMMTGWIPSQYEYTQMISIDKNKEFENTKAVPMQGQCSQVFKPSTMLAVSAASRQPEAALEFMDAFLSADVQGVYDGLPINQNAYDIQFTPNPEYLGENGEYGSWVSSDADGNRVSFQSFWASDDEIADFKKKLSMVNTAYIPDMMLENAVFTQGISYMRGEQSMDETLDAIEKAVAIYMAE